MLPSACPLERRKPCGTGLLWGAGATGLEPATYGVTGEAGWPGRAVEWLAIPRGGADRARCVVVAQVGVRGRSESAWTLFGRAREGGASAVRCRPVELVDPTSAGPCLPSYLAHQRSRRGSVKDSPTGPSGASREAGSLTGSRGGASSTRPPGCDASGAILAGSRRLAGCCALPVAGASGASLRTHAPASRALCAVGLLGEAGAADVAAPSRPSAMLGRRQAHRPATRRSWAVAHPYGRARPARADSLHHFRAIRALFSRRTTAVAERGRGADGGIMHGGLVVALTYAVGEQQAIRPGVAGSQRFPAAARAGALTDHSPRILRRHARSRLTGVLESE
jgi:hypothetical protein